MYLEIWQFVLIVILELLVVAVVVFFISRKLFSNQLKKNPPINEKVIRLMFKEMGRTPSEKQVRSIMKSINEQNK